MDEAVVESESLDRPASSMSMEELETLVDEEPISESEEEQAVDEGNTEEKEEVKEVVKEETSEADQEEKPVSETISLDEFKKLKEDNEALLQKVERQDKFFAKVGTEVGMLRKKTPEEEREKLEQIRDLYLEDPIAGREAHDAYLREQQEAETLVQEEMIQRQIDANKMNLSRFAPEFKPDGGIVSEIAELMAMDGAPTESITAFKENPYLMPTPTMFNLIKRNEALKENASLKEQIEQQAKEIEELRGKPDKILERLEKSGKGKTLTGKSGGATQATSVYDDKPVHRMTKEELEEI